MKRFILYPAPKQCHSREKSLPVSPERRACFKIIGDSTTFISPEPRNLKEVMSEALRMQRHGYEVIFFTKENSNKYSGLDSNGYLFYFNDREVGDLRKVLGDGRSR